LEESVRQRIDYMIGGEDKLVEVLQAMPASMQSDLLASLRGDDPQIAENVSRRLVLIDDLANLEAAEIKLLSRRVPAKLLAVILKSSATLRLSVLPKLAAGTREWLNQEIELSSEPTPEALEAARQPVLAAVMQLVREGRIVLRKKIPEAAPPPSDPVAQEA
jgi:flagellar motor switch protein FliG